MSLDQPGARAEGARTVQALGDVITEGKLEEFRLFIDEKAVDAVLRLSGATADGVPDRTGCATESPRPTQHALL